MIRTCPSCNHLPYTHYSVYLGTWNGWRSKVKVKVKGQVQGQRSKLNLVVNVWGTFRPKVKNFQISAAIRKIPPSPLPHPHLHTVHTNVSFIPKMLIDTSKLIFIHIQTKNIKKWPKKCQSTFAKLTYNFH